MSGDHWITRNGFRVSWPMVLAIIGMVGSLLLVAIDIGVDRHRIAVLEQFMASSADIGRRLDRLESRLTAIERRPAATPWHSQPLSGYADQHPGD